MIIPSQIKHGRWCILYDGSKKYIDDVDFTGEVSPVGHFSIHVVDGPGEANGEWIGTEKVQSVKGANPDPDKQPRTVDLGVAAWSNTTKQMNENDAPLGKYDVTITKSHPTGDGYEITVQTDDGKYDWRWKVGGTLGRPGNYQVGATGKVYIEKKKNRFVLNEQLNEDSAGYFLCKNSGSYEKDGKMYKVQARKFYKHFRGNNGWGPDYLNDIPFPDDDDFKKLFDRLPYDKPKLNEFLQCANCGHHRNLKPVGFDRRNLPVALCTRCDNQNVKYRLSIKDKPSMNEFVKKVKGGYRVISHQTGKNFGTYPTKAAAEKRLAQIHRFREVIKIDVKKGDTILTGKWKNHPEEIKDIGKDDFDMPTINGKKAATFRIKKDIKETAPDLEICDKCGEESFSLQQHRCLNPKCNQFKKEVAGGMAKKNGLTQSDVDPKEFKMGIEVEKEHTDDMKRIKQTVLDHLTENPKYYTKLKDTGLEEDAQGFEECDKCGEITWSHKASKCLNPKCGFNPIKKSFWSKIMNENLPPKFTKPAKQLAQYQGEEPECPHCGYYAHQDTPKDRNPDYQDDLQSFFIDNKCPNCEKKVGTSIEEGDAPLHHAKPTPKDTVKSVIPKTEVFAGIDEPPKLAEEGGKSTCPGCHKEIETQKSGDGSTRFIKHKRTVYGKNNLEMKPCTGSNSVVREYASEIKKDQPQEFKTLAEMVDDVKILNKIEKLKDNISKLQKVPTNDANGVHKKIVQMQKEITHLEHQLYSDMDLDEIKSLGELIESTE